jgi:1-hydroxycarotenoid 3,4-desaturase
MEGHMTVKRRVVVVGAGMGGLAASIALAARGFHVTTFDAADGPGGKMREVEAGGRRIDAGPTVLTMPWVFEQIFEDAGAHLSRRLTLNRIMRLARHAWGDDSSLDLYSDVDQSAEAIADFAGLREADGYRRFCKRAESIYRTLRDTFIRGSRPGPVELATRVGLSRLPDLMRISPFTTLSRALEDHFSDSRLRQLFGRYATYCGSSPFLAPATLMLIAHVEREGVWIVEGGMARLAEALGDLARASGAQLRFRQQVARVVVQNGRAAGVETDDGERIEADAVIWNGDVAAIGDGSGGPEASRAVAPIPPGVRSLSALTWAMTARVEGFPLVRHNVFFSSDYRAEFDDLFGRSRLPVGPTIYVCAQDREQAASSLGPYAEERLFCLVNAPTRPADRPLTDAEITTCEETSFRMLEQHGLRITGNRGSIRRTTPEEFARLFPSTRGALYGRATHGWRASFARTGSKTRLPGLYLAGGSVHPGPGAPMAALSGRQAAMRVMLDLASTRKSYPAAMPGGTSTPSATMANTD